jgi:uncharacterized Ntn-hydrolase superfamily protein
MRGAVPRFLAAFEAVLFLSTVFSFAGRCLAAPGSTTFAPPGFAVVAFDSLRQEWGVAAVSRWIGVGSRSILARAGAGVWVALELPDPEAGAKTLDRMEHGLSARAALDSLLDRDPRREERQVALLDRTGALAGFSGRQCPPWVGERSGRGYLCQGVAQYSAIGITAMGRAFESASGALAERLLAAIEAAEAVSPARDELESAALLVVRAAGGPNGWSDRLVDLRVDADSDAVQSLRRLYGVHAVTFLPAAYARFGDEAKRRGDSITAEQEYARAEAGFRAGIARKPKDPDALNELAWFLAAHDRDLDEAVRLARAAVSARSRDPNLYDTLAEAEYRAGSLTRAIEAMERAVKYSGEQARYVDRLGRWMRERAALEGKSSGKSP